MRLFAEERALQSDEAVRDNIIPPEDGNWSGWLSRLTREQREGLRHVMHFDLVSGLLNSEHFNELFRAEMDRSRRYKRMLSLAVIRIDSYDRVNSEKGRAQADITVKHAAAVLKRQIRSVDVAGRVTDNEIAVLMPETNGPSAAMVAARICNNIMAGAQNPDPAVEPLPELVISVGVASFPRDARDWADLLFWARTDLETHPF